MTLNITEVNDPPGSLPVTLGSVLEDFGERNIPTSLLLENHSPGIGETNQLLTVVAVGNAAGGTVQLAGTNVIFTSLNDFNGTALFSYTVEDNGITDGVNDPKRSVTVAAFRVLGENDPPVPHSDDLGILAESSPEFFIPIATLLNNDLPGPTNEFDQTLTLIAVTDAIGGSYRMVGDSIGFTPEPAFNGSAGFTYTAQDDGTSQGIADPRRASALVTFLISEANNNPLIGDDNLAPIAEDSLDRVIPFAIY